MPKFKNRLFGQNVDQTTIEVFKNLQDSSFDRGPNESITQYEDYLGDRTTFARMWTATLITGSADGFSLEKVVYHIVNDNRERSYEPNQPITDSNIVNELTTNDLQKPKAGITSVATNTEGALGVIKRTTVEFVVHNKNDFDNIFLPFFLKPGSTVVVDFGWSDAETNLYDVSKAIESDDLFLQGLKKKIYGGEDSIRTGPKGEEIKQNSKGKYFYIPKDNPNSAVLVEDAKTKSIGFVNENKGLVDTMIGRVIDYSANVNQQGSFECSLTFTSENTALLDKEITDDNNLKFVFANKMEQIIVSVLSIPDKVEDEDGEVVETIGTTDLSYYDKLSREQQDRVKDQLFKSLKLTNTGNNIGVIGLKSTKNGVFYQNVTEYTPGSEKNNRDLLYICYGLFEDLFLNGLVAENTDGQDLHAVNYNSQDTLVRIEPNLYERQTELMESENDLALFLYPNPNYLLVDNYNNQGEDAANNLLLYTGKADYSTPVMHFRDLFISVDLLSSAFSSKQNVNDALDFILEKINEDSFGVFKLKMVSNNDSFSSVSIVDVNLSNIPEVQDEMLTFDVTSDKSIVYNMDYKYGTPKGGLASMIAIGTKDNFEFFDNQNVDNLNFLNLLGPNRDKFGEDSHFQSLPRPISKTNPDDEDNLGSPYDFSKKTYRTVRNKMAINTGNMKTKWQEVISQIEKEKKDENKSGSNPNVKTTEQLPKLPKDEDIIDCNSIRDYYGKKAQLTTVLGSDDVSISPILPIELSLTTYGNTYLNIGDLFLINFLPKYYLDRVVFQVTNVAQKVGTNWETTYSTVMKVRPPSKSQVVDIELKKPRLGRNYVANLLSEFPNSDFLLNATRNAVPIPITSTNGYKCVKIRVEYNDVVKKYDKVANDVGVEGDSRLIYNIYEEPSDLKNMAFLYALQATMSDFILKADALGAPNAIHGVKDPLAVVSTEVSSIGKERASRFVKSGRDFFYNAIITDTGEFSDTPSHRIFFDKLSDYGTHHHDKGIFSTGLSVLTNAKGYLAERTFIETLVMAFAKQRELEDFRAIASRAFAGTEPEKELLNGEGAKNFGVLTRDFGFAFTQDETDDLKHLHVYVFEFNQRGISEKIMIPSWFFENAVAGRDRAYDVQDFCKLLYEYFFKYIDLITPIAKKQLETFGRAGE